MQISRVDLVESRECPFQFDRLATHNVLALNPLINEGGWSNISEVGNEIHRRLSNLNEPAVIVDLSRLDYMGSSQVALLVRVWKSLKQVHGRMVVYCPGEMVRDVLSSAGLKSLWEIVETREAALKALGVVRSRRRLDTPFWSWLRHPTTWFARATTH